MILYDASYIWWVIYTAVPFFALLILTTLATEKGVNFKDIGPEHGDWPYRLKFLTYVAVLPMSSVLLLSIGSGYYNAFTSL
jgi:hypothetical protein